MTIFFQQQELMEKEQLVLKTKLELSELQLSAKHEELDELNELVKTVDLDSLKEIAIKYTILEQELLAMQEWAILLQDEKNASQSRDKVLAEDFEAVALKTDRLGLEVWLPFQFAWFAFRAQIAGYQVFGNLYGRGERNCKWIVSKRLAYIWQDVAKTSAHVVFSSIKFFKTTVEHSHHSRQAYS